MQQEHQKGSQSPVMYIRIGSSLGDRDAEILAELKKDIDPERLHYIGIDPYVSAEQDVFSRLAISCAFINSGLLTGQNYIGLLQAAQAMPPADSNPIMVATARYAFHHAATSLAKFHEDLGGIPVVLLE